MGKSVLLVCKFCKTDFYVIPYRANKAKFCSKKCAGAYRRSTVPKMRVDKPCAICGKIFSVTPSEAKKRKHCSLACRAKHQSKNIRGSSHPRYTKVSVRCSMCGKQLLKTKYFVDIGTKNFFCDVACHGKWQSVNCLGTNHPASKRVEVHCHTCGKIFEQVPWRAKRSKQFCSEECLSDWRRERMTGENNRNWLGGCEPIFHGPNWLEQREKARTRDGFKCQHCGIHEDHYARELDVHHIIPFRDFGIERYIEANRLSNLITFCRSCHRKAEEGSIAFQIPLPTFTSSEQPYALWRPAGSS